MTFAIFNIPMRTESVSLEYNWELYDSEEGSLVTSSGSRPDSLRKTRLLGMDRVQSTGHVKRSDKILP